jgi:uncharacterized protein
MQCYIQRVLEQRVLKALNTNPVVALLGPRQCGKSTLAKKVLEEFPGSLYLDLEKSSHLQILHDPEAFFFNNENRLVCFDEIQNKPEIFSAMRSVIDERGRNSQFLVLGSASVELLRQSSQSLAGRISFLDLAPFNCFEVAQSDWRVHWLRGGFPRSYLAEDSEESNLWRENFIRTFLERDLPQLGFSIPARTLERFWVMCAHSHGQVLNASKLGESLGVSHHTIKSYLDILDQTYVLRILKPWFTNTKKRLVKSPKVYIRDSGLLHSLLRIDDSNALLGHPIYGSAFEGYVIENIAQLLPGYHLSFFRTSSGAEVDLIMERGLQKIVVEVKASSSPKVSRGFYNALQLIEPTESFIISPVEIEFQLNKGVTVTSLSGFIKRFRGQSSTYSFLLSPYFS